MRQEKLKLNKSSMKNLFISFFDGDFWFGDYTLNIADRKFISENTKSGTKNNIKNHISFSDYLEQNINNKNTFETKNKNEQEKINLENQNINSIENYTKEVPIVSEGNNPNGYIQLYLKDIDVNQLFLKHNITLKYIQVSQNVSGEIKNYSGQKYIKSFILGNQDREIDCYSIGENESLTISKHNSSILNIILKEKSGQQELLTIVNGVVIL